jgi:hypothetical protein
MPHLLIVRVRILTPSSVLLVFVLESCRILNMRHFENGGVLGIQPRARARNREIFPFGTPTYCQGLQDL